MKELANTIKEFLSDHNLPDLAAELKVQKNKLRLKKELILKKWNMKQ